jgi:hypothetical protein
VQPAVVQFAWFALLPFRVVHAAALHVSPQVQPAVVQFA